MDSKYAPDYNGSNLLMLNKNKKKFQFYLEKSLAASESMMQHIWRAYFQA